MATVLEEKVPNMHVLIIGAGVTGLLVAQGLMQAGISFSIFESESADSLDRTRQWGMTIHWSRALLAEILPAELLDKVRDAQVDPSFDSAAAGIRQR